MPSAGFLLAPALEGVSVPTAALQAGMVAWVGGCLATALGGSGDYDAWKDLTLGLMYAACALFVGDHVARWPNCA
eukprot:COSAG04_NODE_17564_length_465_cov_21.120219_1_plen_74_part_01